VCTLKIKPNGFTISKFRCVLNVVCFLLGGSPASSKCQHFGTLCLFHLHRWVDMKCDWGWECWGINTVKGLAWKIAWANQKEGDGVGAGQSRETGYGGQWPTCRLFLGAGQSGETVCGGQWPTWRSQVCMYIPNSSHTSHLPTYEDGTECSEMLPYKLWMPVNHPEENRQQPNGCFGM
jgi:hypothetical protein